MVGSKEQGGFQAQSLVQKRLQGVAKWDIIRKEKRSSFAMSVSKVHTLVVRSLKYISHKSIASHGGQSPRLAHKSILCELLHVDIIREGQRGNKCFIINDPKVTKGLSDKQGHQVKGKFCGNGGYRKEADVCTCALCVKYKCLKTLLISLVFQAHMDLSLSSYHMYPQFFALQQSFKFNHHSKINVLPLFQKSGFSVLKGTREIILSNLLSNAGILSTASWQAHTLWF